MQEKRNADSRATPWEVYFFEEGGWTLLEPFESESEARGFLDALLKQSALPRDFYALIGPEDKVMPLAPASYKHQTS